MKKRPRSLFLKVQFLMTIVWMLATGCSKQADIEEEGEYILKFDEYASSDFLRKWNNATIEQIKEGLPNDTLFRYRRIVNLQQDSISSQGTSRGKFLRGLNENHILSDSLRYNAIYIVEFEHSGEYHSKTIYLIVDSVPQDYFFQFESRIRDWDLTWKGKGEFSQVDELYSYFSSGEGRSGEEADNAGALTITKATPDTLLTETVYPPTEEQMNRISAFYKQVMVADSTVRSLSLKQK